MAFWSNEARYDVTRLRKLVANVANVAIVSDSSSTTQEGGGATTSKQPQAKKCDLMFDLFVGNKYWRF